MGPAEAAQGVCGGRNQECEPQRTQESQTPLKLGMDTPTKQASGGANEELKQRKSAGAEVEWNAR